MKESNQLALQWIAIGDEESLYSGYNLFKLLGQWSFLK